MPVVGQPAPVVQRHVWEGALGTHAPPLPIVGSQQGAVDGHSLLSVHASAQLLLPRLSEMQTALAEQQLLPHGRAQLPESPPPLASEPVGTPPSEPPPGPVVEQLPPKTSYSQFVPLTLIVNVPAYAPPVNVTST